MEQPRLEVTSPSGEITLHDLDRSILTVGRKAPTTAPDVSLDDQSAVISRVHCLFEFKTGHWWISDNESRNGTYLLRRGIRSRVDGSVRLQHGDAVQLLAIADTEGASLWWELRLEDPHSTAAAATPPVGDVVDHSPTWVEWLPAEMRLIRHHDGESEDITLRKQGYTLIGYLAARNVENDGVSVVCTSAELMEAIWGPHESWDRFRPPTAENLRDVVASTRRVLEPDISAPTLLENMRGLGYRLRTS